MFRLLVVDDEPYIVESLAEMLLLSDLPFKEIKIAYSAGEALTFFEQAAFDIVIADIRMPEMDGLEFFEKVKVYWTHTKFIFLTGHSDFSYAQKAMKLGASDYLLKPADDDEIIACLKKVILRLEQGLEQMMELEQAKIQARQALPVLQSEFFRYILYSGDKLELETLINKFKQLEYRFNPDRMMASLIFRIDEWEDRFNPDDEPLIQFAVQNMLNEILDSTCSLISFRYDDGLVAMLLQPKQETDSEHIMFLLKERLAEAQDTIYRALGVTVSFALTGRFFTWKHLYIEFSDLVACIRQSMGKGILTVQESGKPVLDSLQLNASLNEVKMHIQNKNEIEFKKCVARLFSGVDKESPGIKESTAFLFINISGCLLNILMQYNLVGLLEPAVLEKLTNLYGHKNFDSIIKIFADVFGRIVNALDSYNSHPARAIVEQVRNYIDGHLGEVLSLDELGRKVSLNPSYLSRVFHQTQGEQLIAYITRRKMEYAKQLLLSTDLKIHEISERTGFMNANYFAKVFRKTYGMSPQDYLIFHSMGGA